MARNETRINKLEGGSPKRVVIDLQGALLDVLYIFWPRLAQSHALHFGM